MAGQTSTTDASGRFSLRDLPAGRHQIRLTKAGFQRPYSSPVIEHVPPGEYDVFAWEFVELDAYRSEDFLRQFEGRSLKLSVSPNSQASIRLQAIGAETTR